MHKAKELPKEGFKGEVERHLTGKETEPWKMICFKLYKSQIPVAEKALESAGPHAKGGQVTRILPGDDLCRSSRWRQSRGSLTLKLVMQRSPYDAALPKAQQSTQFRPVDITHQIV